MENALRADSAAVRKKNENIYIGTYIGKTVANRLAAGAFTTAFLVYIGFTTENISLIQLSINLGLIAASILIIPLYRKDRSGLSILRISAWGSPMIPLGVLIASFFYQDSFTGVFILLLFTSCIGNLLKSMNNSAEINAAPMLFGTDRYRRITGKCGIIGGAFTLALTLSTMFLTDSKNAGIGYYRIFFALASVILIVTALMRWLYKRPADSTKEKAAEADLKRMFSKKYLKAALPHLLRGFGTAAFSLWPAVVIRNLSLTPFLSSVLIPLGIAAEILGSALFNVITKRLSTTKMTAVSFFISAVCMFLTPVIRTVPFYFICFFIHEISTGSFARAILPSIVDSCDDEERPMIAALHVLYYAVTFCPAVILFGKWMDAYTFPCMLAGGTALILGGFLWVRYLPENIQKRPARGEKVQKGKGQ